jgi:phosphatidylglycerophosphatase A
MDTKRFLTASLGLGWLPLAPGSWGSLGPAGIFALMGYCSLPLPSIMAVMGVLFVAGCVGSIALSPHTIAVTGDEDPDEVVLDEVAGQPMCFMTMPLWPAAVFTPHGMLAVAAAGFFFFRLFDTLKPWPCKRLEDLPKGWGILADDLVAGIYAAIVLVVAVRWYVAS